MKNIAVILMSIALAPATTGALAATDVETASRTAAANLLATVDTSDGVDRAEAAAIAEAYFDVYVGCGNYSGISERGDFWVVEGQFGFAGLPIKDFLISKATGAISSPIGPSHSKPAEMLGPNNSFKPKPLRGSA